MPAFFQLTIFVPVESLEVVKEAIFCAGAGRLANYERCSFESYGFGQFRPLSGATPALGEVGVTARVHEARLELLIKDADVDAVLDALRHAHPYEVPAFYLVGLDDRCLPKMPGA